MEPYLREIRKHKNRIQRELANLTNTRQANLSNIEQNKKAPNVEMRER